MRRGRPSATTVRRPDAQPDVRPDVAFLLMGYLEATFEIRFQAKQLTVWDMQRELSELEIRLTARLDARLDVFERLFCYVNMFHVT